MKLKKATYLLTLLLSFAVQLAYTQSYTSIGGVINEYVSITAIQSAQNYNPDSVVVTDASAFRVDDTVMVYCVKGAIIGTGDPFYTPGDALHDPGWDAQDPRNTGKYAFFLISEVIGNTIVLNASLNPEILPMGAGEVAQLIKVRSYRYARVDSLLGAAPWDPATGSGGVLALFVHGVLRLDADIDVSMQGFKGAPGSTDTQYTSACLNGDTMSYFYLDGEVWAGLKGEGITDTRFLYHRGKASSINGGGGGNGLLAGGGGGSNYYAGVRGGEQSTQCTPGDSLTGGAGGFPLGLNGWYYINGNPQNRGNRIFFGGGGGSGTHPAGSTSTDGGNGGGIVVIVADTIDGNGHWIRADGGDVSGTAVNGAGAGGGAGGCIILEVAGYQNTLHLSAVGGDGGNTSGTDTTGMGGAGSGGIYWVAGSGHPEIVPDFSTGTNGTFLSVPPYAPLESPRSPYRRDNLVAPLRGFLFNPVPSEFTVCSDQDPDPIVTSVPKGGDGTYTYQWIDSSKTQNFWADIVGATAKDYDPGPLSDTTYFRRIISSAGVTDTSFRIAAYVHPAITGNSIAASDTVCSGNVPELFISSGTIGGGPDGGTYTYLWQEMPDGSGTYTDLTGVTSEPSYQAGSLITSTNYRRIAYSGVCIDTSSEGRVRVLQPLAGNNITPFDTICIHAVPDQISGPVPSDGDQADIRYQWLSSTDPGLMGSVLPGETGISYQSSSLDQTTYIRRVVLSGNGDACRDTSAYVEILNIPDITNNLIEASQTLCQEDQADLLTGFLPGGGYLGQYSYTWIASTDQTSWVPAAGPGSNEVMTGFDPGVMSGDTTWYRRVVGSGGLELACKDTSASVVINVLPSITNNAITPVDEIKCQGDLPDAINGSLPGGGATVGGIDLTQSFRWELAEMETEPGSAGWTHPSSGATAQDYTDPDPLTSDVDRWYRRIVFSGPAGECVDTSNRVHLEVHSEITANAIGVSEAICFQDSRALRHESLAGGEQGLTPVYTWRSWQEGETSADAVDLAGSDQQAYVSGPYTDPATLTYYYDRVVEIGACRDTSNAMMVMVMQLPGGELTDAGFDACEQETVLHLDLNMDGLTAGHYVTPWNVYLEDGIHTGIGPGLLDQDMDTMGIVLSTGENTQVTYSYQIESIRYYPEGDAYACISTPALLTGDPVVVNVWTQPEPVIQANGMVGDSYEVCDDTATLILDPDNGTPLMWSEPAGSLAFSPASGQDEYHVSIPDNPEDYGAYRIYLRSEVGDCSGIDSLDLQFFKQPEPAKVIDESIVVYLTDSTQLNAEPPTAGVGTWSKAPGSSVYILDENDPNTSVLGLEYGENTFTWTVENGEDEGKCITHSGISVVVRNEVKRYEGFSPNGDQSNEYYIMQGLVYADEFSISFFNSLGNTVRTITEKNVGELEVDESMITGGLKEDEMVVWDGRASNGNLVPSGTYYYVVIFMKDTDRYEDKGHVVVVRE